MKKIFIVLIIFIAIAVMLLGLIQFVPYGRQHTNPPLIVEPKWDKPQTRQLAERACFACHSNQTIWPWYSHIAPISWLVQRDVNKGRRTMNFSEWDTKNLNADVIIRVIKKGKMPPIQYLIMHPESRLSQNEKDIFIQGLMASLGSGGG